MSSLKQVVYNALMKVATPVEGVEQIQFDSAEAARDDFVAKVMAELFPEGEQPAAVAPKKVKKAKKAAEAAPAPEASPKKSPEEKAAEKAAAKEAEKKAKEEAKAAEKAAKEEAKAAKKAAKSPKKADAEPAAAGAGEPAPEPKPASPKKPKKAKANPDANLPKIDPTWRKALKEADKEHAKELEPELLTYVNLLANPVFHNKGVKEHIADFLAARAAPAPAPEGVVVDLEVVEFNGKEYYVNPETKRVYEGEMNEAGELTVTRPVGYVGMADFKDMVL